MSYQAPNILFIQTDQLTAFSLQAYGNNFCKTPNIDKLANNGVVFETAYCNFPLCAPSRYSMAAGQLASRIGAYDNAVEFPATIPTYAHYLRAAGYQTCLSGKMHFVGPDQLHGFEQRLTPDIYPADFSWAPNWADEGQRDTSDTTGVTTSGQCADSVQLKYDNLVQQQALNKLNDIGNGSDNRPFFLQVSFTHPHDPYLCLKEHWDRYENQTVPMPAVSAQPGEWHDEHSRRILAQHSMLDYEFDVADIERARRAYYGSVSYIDDRVGELINALAEHQLVDNTIVVFTSDHGEMLGERGMWFKKTFFEPALRIPMIVNCPKRIPAKRVYTPVSLLDLLPTFMRWASDHPLEPIEPLDGEDLNQFIDSNEDNLDRVIRAEYLSETTTSPIYMVKRGPLKFISSADDADLLFDLGHDPNELNNVAEHPDYAEHVKWFKQDIQTHWDNAALTRDILLSQKRRQLLIKANSTGQNTPWDFAQTGTNPAANPTANSSANPNENAQENPQKNSEPWYRGQQGYNAWAYDYTPVPDKQ